MANDEFLKRIAGKRVVVFGSGPTAQDFFYRVPVGVAYIVDNAKEIWGNIAYGYEVKSPRVLLEERKDETVVVVASSAVEEIIEQLESYGYNKEENIILSPGLVYRGQEKVFLHPLLVVTCIGHNGGVYTVDLNRREVVKHYDGNCRGIVHHGDTFIVSLEDRGLVRLDRNFEVVQEHLFPENINLHGLCLDPVGERLFLNETGRDRIGVYAAHSFERIDEIHLGLVKNANLEQHHINDVEFLDGELYICMFSSNGIWRHDIWNDGTLATVDIENKKLGRVLVHGLMQPHSLHFIGRRICFCNSMACQVCEGDKVICQFNGYTRGLESYEDYYYIGQSEVRRLSRFRHRFNNIAMDTGIHVWNSGRKVSRFFHVPAEGIFDIILNQPQ